MNRALSLSLILGLLALGSAWGAEKKAAPPAPFFRTPAISADGSKIAFSYQGDLWVAQASGTGVRRLTDHRAYDTRPVFSPTANLVAFSSDREGGMDVYVVSGDGGQPRRLTFHSADDAVAGFSPSGNAVLFISRRDTQRHRLYYVSLDGGEPVVLLDAPANHASFSPDGKSLAFTVGAMSWWRRKYKGSGNFDIWIKSLGGGNAKRITTWAGNDTDVLWGQDGQIYFVSDRTGVANLWKLDPRTSPATPRQITAHKRHPVLRPSLSADGRWIIYANLEGGLYLLSVKTGKANPVPLSVVTDPKDATLLRETFTNNASDMAVSPNGKDLAFTVRGDIFVVTRKGGKAVQVTRGPAREQHPCWMPDGKALIFVSDRNGQNDIFRVRSDEEGEERLSKARYFKTETLLSTPVREERPCVSPDGRLVAYLAGLGDLRLLVLEGGHSKLLAKGPMIDDPCWSVDSRWLAFSKAEKDWNGEIYIVKAYGGKPVNVTRDPDDDMEPLFGPKGEYLYFSSSRGGGHLFNIFRLPLTEKVAQRYKEDEEKDKEDEEDEDAGEEKKDKGGKKEPENKKKAKEDEPPAEVLIDFPEIEDRARPVTGTRGNDTMPVISDDGKTLFFKSNSLGFYEIWHSKTDGSALTRLTRSKDNPEEMVWTGKKELVYRTGGTLHTLSQDGKRGSVGYRARMRIDLSAERGQTFDEAWTVLRDFFYDPKMHGVDWVGCKKDYRPFARDAICTEDFNAVVSLMLGELNASHLGIYGPDSGRSPEKTGFTGLRMTPGPKDLRYVVTEVIKDSPADRAESKVKVGEFLVSVNRTPVKAGQNLALLLNAMVGERMDLAFADTEDGAVKHTVTLKPVDPGKIRGLLYDHWVDDRRRRVEQVKGVRLGYIHIRAMSGRSFRRFRREYLAKVRDRDGLVLDVRNNPGGYIHNQLWELLSKRRPVGFFRIRGASSELQPDFTWQKPVVLLINERSASDAEIFPHGFRRLGLGKVIGVPTWGGVIGTGGTVLTNGAWFRLPFVGWYTHDGTNLENLGVKPDIHVENHPEEEGQGIDRQLERAIAELVKDIKK